MAPAIETALIVFSGLAVGFLALVAASVFSSWAAGASAPWIWVSSALLLSTIVGGVARRVLARRRAWQLAQTRGRRDLGLSDTPGREEP
jgi:hypothetical protein